MMNKECNDISRSVVTVKRVVSEKDPKTACDFLTYYTGISKRKIKDAMNKGAVWYKSKHMHKKRLRRSTYELQQGDELELYYDEKLLSIQPIKGRCLKDMQYYSIWYKPAGLLTQGTQFGDHCALNRHVERYFKSARPVFVIHRLDREVSGLVLFAHTKDAAGRLSELFQQRAVRKQYLVEVHGNISEKMPQGIITIPLSGKDAYTEFQVLSYCPETATSLVRVQIKTGRKHQIRRHFEMIGFPVMGDPIYGKENKNTEGLKISANRLMFQCPFSHQEILVDVSQDDFIFQKSYFDADTCSPKSD